MPKQAKIAGEVVTRERLAGILGCSPTTIDRYRRAGCPQLKHGRTSQGHEFNTAEIVKWLIERSGSGAAPADASQAEARRRRELANAELAELKLRKLRGELVAIEDCLPILREELANVRSRLMAIPGRLAQSLAAMTDALAVERAIDDEIQGALSEITCDGSAQG